MSTLNDRKKSAARAILTRQTTRGPLDAVEDNPISVSSSVHSSTLTLPTAAATVSTSQVSLSPRTPAIDQQLNLPSPSASLPASPLPEPAEPISEAKDLSFLLDASTYHPLSQLEVPGPFRKPFLPPPTTASSLQQCLSELEQLLEKCAFLHAAQYAGSVLTSGILRSTDTQAVFYLLSIRYSCLELSGNLVLAAQEAKALEDLNSSFYLVENLPPETIPNDGESIEPPPSRHVMPFSLRMQAVRLQSIGFSDPRRGVSALYDLGLECRQHLNHPSTSRTDRKIWGGRLEEIGVRVINALIEMGDLECAHRLLQSTKPVQTELLPTWTGRMVLLLIKMGDVRHATALIDDGFLSQYDQIALKSLLAVADGDFEAAIELLTENEQLIDTELSSLLKQNLAVAYLYVGDIEKSRKLMAELVDEKHSFQSLTINLATLYELTFDNARDLKTALINKLGSYQATLKQPRAFVNADFKL